jgi:AAA15 family ATPase/GTPase
MIISLRFSNFYSFAQETNISFEISKKPALSNYDLKLENGRRLNKVTAVVGANGSGKTQLIKPLAFLSWFVCHSFLGNKPDDPIPFQPHALFSAKNSEFELQFLLGNEEFRYRLVINTNKIVHESLHKKTSHLFSYIFSRDLKADGSGFDVKQQGFSFASTQAKAIRSNASLLSAAYNYDVPEAADFVNYFHKMIFNLNVLGRRHFNQSDLFDSAELFYQNSTLNQHMQQIICELDLGMASVRISEAEARNNSGEISTLHIPSGIHLLGDTSFELPFFEESSGTQSAFVLLSRILPVLEQGGIAIIDELDNDLHPHLLPHLMDLFKFEHSNPHQAQLIFTCHTPEVLNLLKKHQVYLVQKNQQQSESWRLDEVAGLRADDNLYAKYMAGALNAVPDL